MGDFLCSRSVPSPAGDIAKQDEDGASDGPESYHSAEDLGEAADVGASRLSPGAVAPRGPVGPVGPVSPRSEAARKSMLEESRELCALLRRCEHHKPPYTPFELQIALNAPTVHGDLSKVSPFGLSSCQLVDI